MVYKNNIDPVQKRYWPSTKAILTQYKSDTGPVQNQYWPGTKAIPFDTVFGTVTQRVCTGSTGTRYKSGTGIRYRYVYQNGVQDVYRKVPYRYLVPSVRFLRRPVGPRPATLLSGLQLQKRIGPVGRQLLYLLCWAEWSTTVNGYWHKILFKRYIFTYDPNQH